jgi:general secretion pathway protein F
MDYDVTAVFPGRGVAHLRVTADSPEALAATPALQGGVIVSAEPLAARRGASRAGKFPLPLFTRQLLSLLQAGLTIVEGLETLAAQDKDSATSDLLNGLLARLREGQSLSAALQYYPAAFPDLYVATVKASESDRRPAGGVAALHCHSRKTGRPAQENPQCCDLSGRC